MGALGVNAGAAFEAREAARALAQLIPVAGSAILGAVAYGTTHGIGKRRPGVFSPKCRKRRSGRGVRKAQRGGESKI